MKNLRRPARAGRAGIDVTPPTKKMKVSAEVPVSPSASEMAAYMQHIKYMQKSYSFDKWSISSVATLLEQTAVQRRRWIMDEYPKVKEVLDKFPCLKEPKLVSICALCLSTCKLMSTLTYLV